MGLRPGHCYSGIQRSYTRKSKFKSKGYVKAIPASKIVRFDMGDTKKKFSYAVNLVSKVPCQLRHNALESSRQAVNRKLAEHLGNNYFFKVRVYPHHVLRENKMITGAGADRMQTGMQLAFGRPIGIAAQVIKNQRVFTVKVDQENIKVAKEALHKGTLRLPGDYTISIERLE